MNQSENGSEKEVGVRYSWGVREERVKGRGVLKGEVARNGKRIKETGAMRAGVKRTR